MRRAIPAVSEKMLIQQLRQMERDGVVRRFVHHQVPPKVEYSLTEWGQALCPALDALLTWVDLRDSLADHEIHVGVVAFTHRWRGSRRAALQGTTDSSSLEIFSASRRALSDSSVRVQ